MIFHGDPWARLTALFCALTVLASCGLPQVGPNKQQIYAGSVQRSGNAFVVEIDDRVTQITSATPALGFSETFRRAGKLGSDTIRAGDVLGLTIWEGTDQGGILTTEGANSTILSDVQVDGAGFIFVPYAGRIKAAGNSPERLRQIITQRLADQTLDPQVEVRRAPGDGSTVSLIGAVGGQGILPIERPTRTLAAMLAQAGGVSIPPEIAQITVTRGKHQGKIWFQDLYENPELDIALRGGDRILVEEDTREFVALGATGGQAVMRFETQNLSALEAIAQVGGLNASTADPTGVFIMRSETQELANAVLGRSDLIGPQRFVYLLDLTQPNGMFEARDFIIRDGDTLYVTEAPYAQFTKIISALTGSATSLNALSNLAGNNN